MSFESDLEKIMDHAHSWNWLPDWGVVEKIYRAFPNSYSVMTPFAYAYLEELIRSMTSDYGVEILDDEKKPKKHKVSSDLIKLAIAENNDNTELVELLEQTAQYFSKSSSIDNGNNRHSVAHGFMHPRFWDKESFEMLVHDIALLSQFAGF